MDEVVADYDFSKEIETDKLDLLGIEQQVLTSGIRYNKELSFFIDGPLNGAHDSHELVGFAFIFLFHGFLPSRPTYHSNYPISCTNNDYVGDINLVMAYQPVFARCGLPYSITHPKDHQGVPMEDQWKGKRGP